MTNLTGGPPVPQVYPNRHTRTAKRSIHTAGRCSMRLPARLTPTWRVRKRPHKGGAAPKSGAAVAARLLRRNRPTEAVPARPSGRNRPVDLHDDSYFCHRGGGQVVFKNTCESLLFAMRAVSSVAHQPHLGFLSGCDRELKHGFTFPLSSSSDAGDPPDTCIMQSCNHAIV